MSDEERSEDPFAELREDDDIMGLSDALGEGEEGEDEEGESIEDPNLVTDDPSLLEEEAGPDTVTFTVPTGKFREGRPVKVKVTLSIPENALDIAAQFISYQTKARAEMMLWDHFVDEPEWLVEPERHGIYYQGGEDFLVHPSKLDPETQSDKITEYEQQFTESEQETHKQKLLPKTLRSRLTEKIQLAAGVDGDFIEDRLAQMPPDVVQRAAKLSSQSQNTPESPQAG